MGRKLGRRGWIPLYAIIGDECTNSFVAPFIGDYGILVRGNKAKLFPSNVIPIRCELTRQKCCCSSRHPPMWLFVPKNMPTTLVASTSSATGANVTFDKYGISVGY